MKLETAIGGRKLSALLFALLIERGIMKIILIAGCSTCPHGAQWNLDGTEFMCSKLTAVNEQPGQPLPECPLDDAMEKIKEIVKNI